MLTDSRRCAGTIHGEPHGGDGLHRNVAGVIVAPRVTDPGPVGATEMGIVAFITDLGAVRAITARE